MKLNDPGKYDDLATYVREKAKARGVIVIVAGGEKGAGFACQMPLAELLAMPEVLRRVADEIERQNQHLARSEVS